MRAARGFSVNNEQPGPTVRADSEYLAVDTTWPLPRGLGLRCVVVGGSIGGLCTAAALTRLGCEVEILERGCLDSVAGGGIVVQPDLVDFLTHFKVIDPAAVCVRSAGRQHFNAAGELVHRDDIPQLFTAWDTLWRALRAAAEVPYHSGAAATSLRQDGSSASVHAGGAHSWQAELVVGADGPGSFVRSCYEPGVASRYAGYIAWRGWMPEQDAPAELLQLVGNRFNVCEVPCSHILVYPIPGEAGELSPGSRRLNWVWYVNADEAQLPRLLADQQGQARRYSVGRGELSLAVEAELKALAERLLPRAFAALVGATPAIFAQTIHDLTMRQLAWGRCCLLGDAAFIARPHTAAGTTKAALNAWQLAAALVRYSGDVERALGAYQAAAVQLGNHLHRLGVLIGTRSQFPTASSEEGGLCALGDPAA